MAGVNKVILVGNLGADPEARSLNNGGEVVNLRVATSESWKDRDGNRQERTEWHQVVIFNENLAGSPRATFARAARCISKGRSRPGNGPTNRATTATRLKIVLQRFRGELVLLDSREGSGGNRSSVSEDYDDFGGGDGTTTRTQARPQPAAFDTDLDDDVPF